MLKIFFDDPNKLKNSELVDFNDKKLDNFRFVEVNSVPPVGEHLTANHYVDQAISNSVDDSTLVRNIQDNDSDLFSWTNIISIALKTQVVKDDQVNTKSYIDQCHQENEQSRGDLG